MLGLKLLVGPVPDPPDGRERVSATRNRVACNVVLHIY